MQAEHVYGSGNIMERGGGKIIRAESTRKSAAKAVSPRHGRTNETETMSMGMLVCKRKNPTPRQRTNDCWEENGPAQDGQTENLIFTSTKNGLSTL